MALRAGQRAADLAEAYPDADGQPRSIADSLARGPLVLGIYKSSCQASKTIFPLLERLHDRYGTMGLTVLGVSQDSANIARSFTRRTGVTFPLLIEGTDYPITRALDVTFTPTVYLIQPDWTIAFAAEGFLRDQINDLGDTVQCLLYAPRTSLIPETKPDVPFFVPG